ncbi:hypothetical protein F3N42_03575 [Marinihelvus fidelis]|uniref:Uncharacterized protein n=1 Tax=Marinihelvus fidelis TaxID=2613842 RepID=A0A5N0TEI5_9GAMM|nr:hypothetical protein [Marinihelvus fidelis]KAA9133442.1 hypothetical protein F3N42_03575 [Marinihelvus fidelis]
MNSSLKFLCVLLAVITVPAAEASNRAINCDGCTYTTKANRAKQAVTEGYVYVFDALQIDVKKFRIYDQLLGDDPRGRTGKVAQRLDVEPKIRDPFHNFIESVNDILGERLVLPDTFDVRSVAGALYDPAYTTTLLESHMYQLESPQASVSWYSELLGNLLDRGIPYVDVTGVTKEFTMTVEFPDGSYMDFEFTYEMNHVNNDLSIEIEPAGNARLANGDPAPTSDSSFREQRFDDDYGALFEWQRWANALDVEMRHRRALGNYSYMVCKVDQYRVVCTLYRAP